MILTPAAGATLEPRTEIELIGTKDGSNVVFTTPEKFIVNANLGIKTFWNGRKLARDKDFTVSESGGVGTGYDTITILWTKLKPRTTDELIADYYVDQT